MDGVASNVPLPRPVRGSGKPRAKAKKVPVAVREAALAYKQAYKAVYGVPPSLRYDPAGQWIRITGQSQGVKLSRLKAMTTQLRARIA
jgi:hypothetical protein